MKQNLGLTFEGDFSFEETRSFQDAFSRAIGIHTTLLHDNEEGEVLRHFIFVSLERKSSLSLTALSDSFQRSAAEVLESGAYEITTDGHFDFVGENWPALRLKKLAASQALTQAV